MKKHRLLKYMPSWEGNEEESYTIAFLGTWMSSSDLMNKLLLLN